jgi:magnesium and cobalt transporter
VQRPDGTWLADARTTIEEFESRVGPVLTEDERAHDIDTLGGLVMSLTDRVPSRGELVTHSSGIAFEVIDADPRRIKRLRVRNAKPIAPAERA